MSFNFIFPLFMTVYRNTVKFFYWSLYSFILLVLGDFYSCFLIILLSLPLLFLWSHLYRLSTKQVKIIYAFGMFQLVLLLGWEVTGRDMRLLVMFCFIVQKLIHRCVQFVMTSIEHYTYLCFSIGTLHFSK